MSTLQTQLAEDIPVFFKGARVTAHLLQNLALLGLRDGTELETSYGERWLAPNAAGEQLPRTGEQVMLVLCAPPYRNLIPARMATLDAVEARGSFHSYRMTLGPFLTTESRSRIGRVIGAWRSDHRPRERFLARGLGGEQIEVATSEDATANHWTRLIEGVRKESGYERALFARVIETPDVLALGEPGDVILQTADHAEGAAARIEVHRGEITVVDETHQAGRSYLRLIASAGDELDATVTLSTGDFVGLSLPIHARVEAAQPDTTQAEQDSSVQDADRPSIKSAHMRTPADSGTSHGATTTIDLDKDALHRLLRDASRGGDGAADFARRLAELAVQATPDDPELAAEAAHLMIVAERWQEAASLLERFDPADLRLSALYERFLADCVTDRLDDARALMPRLDFDGESAFETLRTALSFLPDHSAVELGLELIENALGEARSYDLFRDLRSRIGQPDHVHDFASAMQYVSEDDSIDLLLEHTEDGPPNRKLLELLVTITAATPGNQRVGPQLVALGELRLEEDDLDGVFDLLEIAKTEARPAQRVELVSGLAEALGRRKDRRHDAIALLATEVDNALSAGLIEAAAELGQQAVGISAGDAEAEDLARDAAARAERALMASEPLRSLLRERESAKIEQVRKRIGGTRAVLFGGHHDDATEEMLRAQFGFNEVRWFESEKNKSINLDPLRQMSGNSIVVIIITDKIGHSKSDPVKDHCQRNAIPCIGAQHSADAIKQELLAHQWPAG